MQMKHQWCALAKKCFTVSFWALVATLWFSNFTQSMFRKLIRKAYLVLRGKHFSSEAIEDDSYGIPIVHYGEILGVYIGKQRNPVTVSQRALDYYERCMQGDERDRQLFLNCADWLIDNMVWHDGYTILEYAFPWPIYDLTPPWRSGMAHGQAIQVLVRAHKITNEQKYLESAKRLLRSFFVEVQNGGVTYKTESDGWWYEEYAGDGAKESRVLNGMLFALLGIQELHTYTGDLDAKYLFEQGILALKRDLPAYDKNGYSYYDILGNPAGYYHKIHIQLLAQLYGITKEEILKAYHDRWQAYKEPPFIVRLVRNPTRMDFAVLAGNFLALLFAISGATYLIQKSRRT